MHTTINAAHTDGIDWLCRCGAERVSPTQSCALFEVMLLLVVTSWHCKISLQETLEVMVVLVIIVAIIILSLTHVGMIIMEMKSCALC